MSPLNDKRTLSATSSIKLSDGGEKPSKTLSVSVSDEKRALVADKLLGN